MREWLVDYFVDVCIACVGGGLLGYILVRGMTGAILAQLLMGGSL